MGLVIAIALFLVFSLFAAWVIYWGGDDSAAGWAVTAILLRCLCVGEHTNSDLAAIRMVVGMGWILAGLWLCLNVVLYVWGAEESLIHVP
jgi:hypothetical protein